MAFGWFVAFLILLFIELITVNLVTIWFAIGALSASVVAMFCDSIIIQSIVFVCLSIVSLLITKPLVKKIKKVDFVPTNSDRVIGKIGEVTKSINPNKYGEVKVFDSIWTAKAKNNSSIEVGERVKILSIEGVKLIVEKEDK